MPTIKQLPAATSVAASDLLPLSQGGTTKALAVGSLLSSVQTAISVPASKLLGRVSATAGAPEVVGIGTGLTIAAGSVLATAADHTQLPISTGVQTGDEVIVNSQGQAKRMPTSALRSLFAAGAGVTIDGSGTISATGGAGFAGVSSFNSRSGPITLTSADLSGAGGALAANVPTGATTAPLADGIAASGNSPLYARQDHVHPVDSTRLATVNNLSDLTNIGSARSNLGLGAAAVLNVGTAAGTVAAGDDSRITGAQPAATIGAASITATGATTARSLAARAGDKVSVKDFGAVGNGAVDDTAAIVAALATGRTVYFPTGTYNYSSPLTVAAGMEGEDARLVTLNNTAPAGVGIVLSGSRPRVSGITLNASAVRAANSGYVIYVSPATYGASIERVTVSGHWADHGIALDGAGLTHIRQIDFLAPASGSNTTTGSAIVLTDNPIDTYIDGVNVDTWNVGMRLTHAGGVYVSRVDFVKCQHGFVFDPSASSNQGVFGAFFTQALADTSTSDGWLFTSDGGIADIAIGMSWPSSSVGTGSGGSVTGSGMRVDNPHVNGLTLTGVHCLNNWKHGLELLQGSNIGIVNCQVTENSIAGPATYDGIYIAPAVSQVRIVGNFIGQGGSIDSPPPAPNTPNFHRYGVNAVNTAPGDTRNITLVGNQLPSNVTAALNMPTGPGIVQTGNTDGTGVLAGTYATTNNPSFTGNVEITGDGSAPNAYFRVSSGNFQICNSSYTAVLLNLTPNSDLATTSSISSAALNVQANNVTRWRWAGGDTLVLSACDSGGISLGSILDVDNTTQVLSFSKTPLAPTALPGSNTTQVATTAFVAAAVQGTGIRITSGASYAMQGTDRYVIVSKTSGSPTVISLPASPLIWTSYVIKDGKGDASSNNITLTGNAPVDGLSSFVIDQAYESVTVIFDGLTWSVV